MPSIFTQHEWKPEDIKVINEIKKLHDSNKSELLLEELESLKEHPASDIFTESLTTTAGFNILSRKAAIQAIPDNKLTIKTRNLSAAVNAIKEQSRQEPPKSFTEAAIQIIYNMPKRLKYAIIGFILIIIAILFAVKAVDAVIGEETRIAFFGNLLRPSEASDFAPVAIDEQTVLLDLSKWTPAGTAKSHEATWSNTMQIRRINNDADSLTLKIPSTVSEPAFSAHKFTSARMRDGSRYTRVKIAEHEVHKPFQVAYELVDKQSFTDDKKGEMSVPVLHPTTKLIVELEFPQNKIPSKFVLNDVPPSGTAIAIPTTELAETTPSARKWMVQHPMIGHSYSIQWDW